jgi:hypothetical protein
VRRLLRAALLACFLYGSALVLLAFPPQVNTAPPTPPRPTDPQFGKRRNHDQAAELAAEKQRERALSTQRYEQVKRDADRLLQLATELKLSVDKSGQNVLALDVVRKADEIEKLAHSVRAKMKGQ